MEEHEKTYLAKYLPKGLDRCESVEIIDLYIPASKEHPTLRIRKKGNHYEITKKEPMLEGDASHQLEQTIVLNEDEYNELSELDGKRTHRIRYFYNYQGRVAEIDIFQDELAGLVWADFEFDNAQEKNEFTMPEFCLADVTQENFIAGGMLAGKTYEDIENNLYKYGYKKLFIDK